jgi:hypothetical protein
MQRTVASVLYWLAAVVITLGAFGHGFVGVLPIREAIETSTLPPDVTQPIWIVWYFTSGSMIAFGLLLFWAWPALKNGASSRSVPAVIVGVLYLISGVASYVYSERDPFWLMFIVLGLLAIGTTLVLGGVRKPTA